MTLLAVPAFHLPLHGGAERFIGADITPIGSSELLKNELVINLSVRPGWYTVLAELLFW